MRVSLVLVSSASCVALALVALSVLFVGCSRVALGEQVAVATSPDGSIDAIVTESSAGATTSYSYNVYLARRGSPRSEWGPRIVSLYAAVRNDHAYGVNVKWTGEDTVVVECFRAGGVKIRRPTTEIQGREVHMTVKTGVVDAQAPSGSMAKNVKTSEVSWAAGESTPTRAR